MKAAATFLLSVTVFTALILETSSNPLESAADVDITNVLTVALAPIESAIATVASLKTEVRAAQDAAAARIGNALNVELLKNTLQELVSKCIEASNAAVAVITTAVDEALAKSKDAAEREVITGVSNFMGEFESISDESHDAIRAAVASFTSEALESVIPSMNNAIEDTKKNVNKQVEILAATPGKRVRDVKVTLETQFPPIIANAEVVLKAMEKVVAAW